MGAPPALAYDFRPMFAQVKPQLSAVDLAICHQETALTATDVGLSGYPVFNSPHEIAVAVADAGYDGCSTASNHSYDHGAQGVVRHDLGVRRGPRRACRARPPPRLPRAARGAHRPRGQDRPARLHVRPERVRAAGEPAVPGQPDQRPADPGRREGGEGSRARRSSSCRCTGARSTRRPRRRSSAPRPPSCCPRPYVDAIVGGHVHVVQPVEKIGNKYVVYGVGNFLSNQSGECCPVSSQDGVIVTLHFVSTAGKWSVGSITLHADVCRSLRWLRHLSRRCRLTRTRTPAPALKQQLAASFQRTAAVMSSLRAPNVAPDLTPPGL